jgi:hypothetical protein
MRLNGSRVGGGQSNLGEPRSVGWSEVVSRAGHDERWRDLAKQIVRTSRAAVEDIKRAVDATLPGA